MNTVQTAHTSTTPKPPVETGLARFEAALVGEIKALQARRDAALRGHDHTRARARRRDIERAIRALGDVAAFRR
jgi:hypothetical protein